MKKICFATNNRHKLEEVSNILGVSLVGLKDIGCVEDIPETADTIEGNSMLKAQYVWDNYGVPCFADDTGLEVKSLNNEPGVLSARYAGEHGNAEANMDLLLKRLANVSDRRARFRTVITLIKGNDQVYQFEGIVEGIISASRSGSKGFGYDPIFIPEGYNKSFAEFSMDEKNAISHRGRAIQKLNTFLMENPL